MWLGLLLAPDSAALADGLSVGTEDKSPPIPPLSHFGMGTLPLQLHDTPGSAYISGLHSIGLCFVVLSCIVLVPLRPCLEWVLPAVFQNKCSANDTQFLGKPCPLSCSKEGIARRKKQLQTSGIQASRAKFFSKGQVFHSENEESKGTRQWDKTVGILDRHPSL